MRLLRFALLAAAALHVASAQRAFDIYQEFLGPRGYTDPAASSNLRIGMANAISLSPPVDQGMTSFVADRNVNVMLMQPGAALPNFPDAAAIESYRTALADLAGALPGRKVVWNLMGEWDQGGGGWVPNGRPRYRGLTRANAAAKFFDYYLNQLFPLSTYLRQTPDERPYALAAVTDYVANTYYAYEMGVDLCLLERGLDELSDISTGVAFVRGASRQYGRQWGIDISTWRTSVGSATRFDTQGNLLGGWSPSYVKRHYYIAYMAGAHALHTEAATYYQRNGQLNPLGEMAKEFADFAFHRHPDVGVPVVPTALLVDHNSGFDPKHWLYNQGDSVWYGDIPYSDGDRMLNNFLKLAWPGHWLHGLAPGAPFADAAGKSDPVKYRQFLAEGGDPRPYEPMSVTRWGHAFDVVTGRVSLGTLSRYKMVILMGGVTIDEALHDALVNFVKGGGVLVLNASQATAAEEELTGATLTRAVRTGNSSLWLGDTSPLSESPYRYTVVTPVTATVLATGNGSDALVTSNRVGRGEVILTTPQYMQNSSRDRLLGVSTRLLDALQSRFSVVDVAGPPVEYLVNQSSNALIVTVLNHSGTEWRGPIAVRTPTPAIAVREYLSDTEVAGAAWGTITRIDSRVPPYDVRVFAVEFPREQAGMRQ